VNIALVIPCHERYELTEIGLDQKVWLQRILMKRHGHNFQVFVVTEDSKHMAMANERGFVVVESDNSALGKRWNDGYEAAARQGYQLAMPCGSDSWLHPDLFRWLPWASNVVVVTLRYSMIDPTGVWRSDLDLHPGQHPFGIGFIWPLDICLSNVRPCKDDIGRGCDTSTLNTLLSHGAELHHVRHRPLEYVAFQSGKQITNIRKITLRHNGTIVQPALEGLADVYPLELVERVADYYRSNRSRRA
jgi:hypothetical protein